MKRILTVALAILCLASCLSFCACGGGATFERGSKADSSYTNQSMNLVFNKPTGWVFYTDEQLAELMDVAKDIVNDKEIFEKAEVSTIYEFMAVDNRTGNNVNMTVEKISSLTSLDSYIKSFKEQLPGQLTGFTVTFEDDMPEITLGGSTFVRLTAHLSASGASMDQYYYFCKVGTKLVGVIATDVNGLTSQAFEDMFTKAE